MPSWRSLVSDVLEESEVRSWVSSVVKFLLLSLIVASVAAVALETVGSLKASYASLFALIEVVAVAVFTLDYALRWWVAPERDPASAAEPWRARLRYAVSAYGVIDLLAILPFYGNLFLPIHPDWLPGLQLLRLLEVSRYAPGLSLFVAVIRNESRPLLAALLVMAVLLVVESGIMFVIEREAQPKIFASLDASRIAEIAGMLKREVVPEHYVVVRRGEPADAMFFIMAGQVEVDVQPRPIRLGRGQYFGEIALLHDTVRTATVTSVSECQLLALDVADFRRLLDAHPDLKAAIMEVAERRLSETGKT